MARSYIFQCDSCTVSHTSRNASLPTSWADIQVNICGFTNWRAGGSAIVDQRLLLCPACQITLQLLMKKRPLPEVADE